MIGYAEFGSDEVMPWNLIDLVVSAQGRKLLGPRRDKVLRLERGQKLPCLPQEGKSVAGTMGAVRTTFMRHRWWEVPGGVAGSSGPSAPCSRGTLGHLGGPTPLGWHPVPAHQGAVGAKGPGFPALRG